MKVGLLFGSRGVADAQAPPGCPKWLQVESLPRRKVDSGFYNDSHGHGDRFL